MNPYIRLFYRCRTQKQYQVRFMVLHIAISFAIAALLLVDVIYFNVYSEAVIEQAGKQIILITSILCPVTVLVAALERHREFAAAMTFSTALAFYVSTAELVRLLITHS